MATKCVRCPKCRGDQISVIEITEVIGGSDFGVVTVDEHDNIFPASDFMFEIGDIVRVDLECGKCKHYWRSRRSVGSSGIDGFGSVFG